MLLIFVRLFKTICFRWATAWAASWSTTSCSSKVQSGRRSTSGSWGMILNSGWYISWFNVLFLELRTFLLLKMLCEPSGCLGRPGKGSEGVCGKFVQIVSLKIYLCISMEKNWEKGKVDLWLFSSWETTWTPGWWVQRIWWESRGPTQAWLGWCLSKGSGQMRRWARNSLLV